MYLARCDYSTAEKLYLQALGILDTRDCQDTDLLAHVLENGAVLMDKTNRETGARLNRARAGEVRSGLYKR